VKLSEFDYQLPKALIASTPPAKRDDARLLVIDKTSDTFQHSQITALPHLLRSGDLLVLNNTKVIPARLFATRPGGGSVELLLTESQDHLHFLALARPAKRLSAFMRLRVASGFDVEVEKVCGDGFFLVRLITDDVLAALDRHGHVPLPPYIDRQETLADRERYQTIFARIPGSSAAPTAGLHFTPELLSQLRAQGIACTELTLHVGPGTFLPVRQQAEDDISKHVMHREKFSLPQACVEMIAQTRVTKGRVIAVGTTVVRTLESVCQQYGELIPCEGSTQLFIAPGFQFRVVNGMVTNFHLPRSTLLILVSAFAGVGRMRAAYEEAIRSRYRFFSYGDACLIV